MALDARARLASDSLIPPTPLATIFTRTSSVERPTKASVSASSEPRTSVLSTILTVATLPSSM